MHSTLFLSAFLALSLIVAAQVEEEFLSPRIKKVLEKGKDDTTPAGKIFPEKRQSNFTLINSDVCLEDDELLALQEFSPDATPFCSSFLSIPASTITAFFSTAYATVVTTLVTSLPQDVPITIPATTVTITTSEIGYFGGGTTQFTPAPLPTKRAVLPSNHNLTIWERQIVSCNDTSLISGLSSACSCLRIPTETIGLTGTTTSTRVETAYSAASYSSLRTVVAGTTTSTETRTIFIPIPTSFIISTVVPTSAGLTFTQTTTTSTTVIVGGPSTSIGNLSTTAPSLASTISTEPLSTASVTTITLQNLTSAVTVPPSGTTLTLTFTGQNYTTTLSGFNLTTTTTTTEILTISGSSIKATTLSVPSSSVGASNSTLPRPSGMSPSGTSVPISTGIPISTGVPMSTVSIPPTSGPTFPNSTSLPLLSYTITSLSGTSVPSAGIPSAGIPSAGIPSAGIPSAGNPPVSLNSSATPSTTITSIPGTTFTSSAPSFNSTITQTAVSFTFPPFPGQSSGFRSHWTTETLPNGQVTSFPYYDGVITQTVISTYTSQSIYTTQVITTDGFTRITTAVSVITLPTIFPSGYGSLSYQVSAPGSYLTAPSGALPTPSMMERPLAVQRVPRIRKVVHDALDD